MKKILLLSVLIFVSFELFSLTVDLKKIFKVGEKLILGEVKSLAQDQQGNLYIPDSKTFKIYKFSPTGQLLFSFGQKGLGPGDFRRIGDVAFTEDNNLVVIHRPSISIFNTKGKLIKKYNTIYPNGAIVMRMKFAGGDFVLALQLINRYDTPPLVLVRISPKMKIVKHNILRFSPLKDFKETVLTNKYSTYDILYSYYGNHSIAALSEKYIIKVFDTKGNLVNTIKRDIDKSKFSDKEKNHIYKTEIERMDVSSAMKYGLKGTIPDKKNIITGITLSNKHIFVERCKEDISDIDALVPIDVLSIKGKYLGQIKMKSLPLLTTDEYFYFLDENDIVIQKYSYQLK